MVMNERDKFIQEIKEQLQNNPEDYEEIKYLVYHPDLDLLHNEFETPNQFIESLMKCTSKFGFTELGIFFEIFKEYDNLIQIVKRYEKPRNTRGASGDSNGYLKTELSQNDLKQTSQVNDFTSMANHKAGAGPSSLEFSPSEGANAAPSGSVHSINSLPDHKSGAVPDQEPNSNKSIQMGRGNLVASDHEARPINQNPLPELDPIINYLSDQLGDDWKNLARALGFNEAEIAAFSLDYKMLKDRGREMLNDWRRRQDSNHITAKEKIVTALRDRFVRLNQFAYKIENNDIK